MTACVVRRVDEPIVIPITDARPGAVEAEGTTMTSLFLGQILAKMADVTPVTKPEKTLEPIIPGASAAWAKAARDDAARSNPIPPKPRLAMLVHHP